jgi:hypothetical protein
VSLTAVCRHCGADGEIGRSIVHLKGCELFVHPFDQPVEPRCPEVCKWRTVCSTSRQEGIRQLWDEGKITAPEQCVFFEHRQRVAAAATRAESALAGQPPESPNA